MPLELREVKAYCYPDGAQWQTLLLLQNPSGRESEAHCWSSPLCNDLCTIWSCHSYNFPTLSISSWPTSFNVNKPVFNFPESKKSYYSNRVWFEEFSSPFSVAWCVCFFFVFFFESATSYVFIKSIKLWTLNWYIVCRNMEYISSSYCLDPNFSYLKNCFKK